MSLVRAFQSVKPAAIGRAPTREVPVGPEETDDFWVPVFDTTFSDRIPRGAFTFGANNAPKPFVSWAAAGVSALSTQASDSGYFWSVSTLPTWRGKTVEVFLMWTHNSATLTGFGRWQLDIGPRENQEAAGAPNDAASQRITTDITVASSAGEFQDLPRYDSLGQFTIGFDDVMLIVELERLGSVDTFGAGLGVFGLHAALI